MAINFPEGTQDLPAKALQIVTTNITSPYASGNMSNFTSMSGFSRAITTKQANSRILIQISFGAYSSEHNGFGIRLYRGGTLVGVGQANASRQQVSFRSTHYGFDGNHCINSCWSFLDEPSASAGTSLTYQLYGRNEGTNNFYINRSNNYNNDSQIYSATFHSSIIVTEIAA